MPSTVLGTDDTAINKTQPLLSWSFHSYLERQIIKYWYMAWKMVIGTTNKSQSGKGLSPFYGPSRFLGLGLCPEVEKLGEE